MRTLADTDRLVEIDQQVNDLLKKSGAVFLARRNALGASLEEVASLVPHLDANGLSKFERGLRAPSLKIFFFLMFLYQLPWEQLFAQVSTTVQQQLLTALLQTPPEVQELYNRLLWYHLHGWPSTEASPDPLPCLSTPLSP